MGWGICCHCAPTSASGKVQATSESSQTSLARAQSSLWGAFSRQREGPSGYLCDMQVAFSTAENGVRSHSGTSLQAWGTCQSGCLVCAREWLYPHLGLTFQIPALAYSGVRIHPRSDKVSDALSLQDCQRPDYPRYSYSYAVTCWPGHCSFLLFGFLCLYLDPTEDTGNTNYIRHTATLHEQKHQLLPGR